MVEATTNGVALGRDPDAFDEEFAEAFVTDAQFLAQLAAITIGAGRGQGLAGAINDLIVGLFGLVVAEQ